MMTPPEPRYQRLALSPGAFEQLTRLVYELLDAHDDTVRIATAEAAAVIRISGLAPCLGPFYGP